MYLRHCTLFLPRWSFHNPVFGIHLIVTTTVLRQRERIGSFVTLGLYKCIPANNYHILNVLLPVHIAVNIFRRGCVIKSNLEIEEAITPPEKNQEAGCNKFAFYKRD